MSHQDWINLFAPTVAAVLTAAGALLVAFLTGVTGKVSAYFTQHGNASAADTIASANLVIDKAVQTGASTIAGKISRGEIDYTNRAAIEAEAKREAALVEVRVPEMIAAAQPVAGALVASMMAKVDQAVVASPTLPSNPVPPTIPLAASTAAAAVGKVPT